MKKTQGLKNTTQQKKHEIKNHNKIWKAFDIQIHQKSEKTATLQ